MIYWDYAAGAPLWPQVADGLARGTSSGNPSSVHRAGREARAQLDAARAMVADFLQAAFPREITFTSSGSEAAALAIFGSLAERKSSGRARLVTSSIEHPCVQLVMKALEAQGAEVVWIAPTSDGDVPVDRMVAALNSETFLCSLMAANNETGVVQPFEEVARACRERGVLFHTDAVAFIGKRRLSVADSGIDLLSFSGHKLGGPAGIGALYVRSGVALRALVPGHQERGLRGGTPNVRFAQALAQSFELAVAAAVARASDLRAHQRRLESELVASFPGTAINGASTERVPGVTSVTFPGVSAEELLVELDLRGICIAAGAACSSGSQTPSPVLTAMGRSRAEAASTVRMSFDGTVLAAEVDAVLAALRDVLPKLAH